MARREFLTRLSQIAALPFLVAGAMQAQDKPSKKVLKIMMKSAWGSGIPPRPHFPFRMDWRCQKRDTMCKSFCWAKPYR